MRRVQGRIRAVWWVVFTLLLLAGTAWALAAGFGSLGISDLWVSTDGGLLQFAAQPNGTLAPSTLALGGLVSFDAWRQQLWLLSPQDQLRSMGAAPSGPAIDLRAALGSATPIGLAADGRTGTVWVATAERLVTVAPATGDVRRIALSAPATAITADTRHDRVWVASAAALTAYDAQGHVTATVALANAPQALVYDPALDQLWVSSATHLDRYTAAGQAILQAPRPTAAPGPLAPDGAGGLWLAGRSHVVHVDAHGFVQIRVPVLPASTATAGTSTPAIVALATDGVHATVWVGTSAGVMAVRPDGRIVQSLPRQAWPVAGTLRSLAVRSTPPTGPPLVLGTASTDSASTASATKASATSASAPASTANASARHAQTRGVACASGTTSCSPTTAGASSHPPARILWATAGRALYQLQPPATTAQALDALPSPQAFAVDPTTGAIWAYRHRQLWSFDAQGVPTVDVKLAAIHGDGHSALAVDDPHAAVWLAIGKTLDHLALTGTLVTTTTLAHTADALALDPGTGQLWVAEGDHVQAFNPQGTPVVTVKVAGNVRAISADADLKSLWVATSHDLLRLDATGQVALTVKRDGDKDRLLAADGAGGVWVAGDHQLSHLSTTGSVDFTLDPLDINGHDDDGENIRRLVADPLTQAAWVAGKRDLVEESVTQQRLALIDSTTWPAPDESESSADHDDTQHQPIEQIALYVDTVPPVLTLATPAPGTYTNQKTPALGFSYSDVGSGVDPSTLTFVSAAGQPFPVQCQTTATTATCTPASALADGSYSLTATVQDYAGNTSAPVALQFTIDTVPPTITVTAPTTTLTNQIDLTLAGTLSEFATLTVNGTAAMVGSNLQFSLPITLTEGSNTYTLVATDRAGNTATTTLAITLDTVPPPQPNLSLFSVTGPVNGQVAVTGQAGSVEGGDTVTLTDTVTGATVSVTAAADGSFTASLAANASDPIAVSVEDPAGNITKAPTPIEASNLPPDPSTVAPKLLPTVQTPFADQIGFLYSGSSPIQTGVAPGTIQPLRVAVVRGQVLNRANQPLPGVTVTVLGHPEYGQTLSRADGGFDLAVNGGGTVVLNFAEQGYLSAQRTVAVPWGDFAIADPLVMIPPDPVATAVTFGATTTAMQVAQGSVQVGQSGSRQATVFIPAGTTATEVLPDGTTQPVAAAHLRATEFTVGANGPEAMPAALPNTSAYTYAVDLSLDEAQAAGATTVQFSQPVPVYVNNYLGIAIGTRVPSGYYDPTVGAWKGSLDGVVVKYLGNDSSGLAELDLDGSGNPATALTLGLYGISNTELAQIAKTFTAGQSFWRVAVSHFTDWDFNYGYNPNAGYLLPPPAQPKPKSHVPTRDSKDGHNCTGCEIDAENQRVGETLPITGTLYALHYESATPASLDARTVSFPVTTATPPAGIGSVLSSIQVTVDIAGRSVVQSFDPSIPSQTFSWTWDGLDAYGQHLYGPTQATIYLAYVYKESYGAFIGGNPGAGQSFAMPANAVMTGFAHSGDTVASTRRWTEVLSPGIESPLGLDRWSVSVVNAYDSYRGILYKGDGTIRSAQDFGNAGIATNFAGTGIVRAPLWDPSNVKVAPDGTVYIWDSAQFCIYKVNPQQQMSVFAGICGTAGYGSSFTSAPKLATSMPLGQQVFQNMAVGSNGSLYINVQNGIVRITPDGMGALIAGGGTQPLVDGQSSAGTQIGGDLFIVSPDHTIYFVNENYNISGVSVATGLWKVDPAGTLHFVLGAGFDYGIRGLAFAKNGDVVFGDATALLGEIKEINPQGQLVKLAGYGPNGGPYASPASTLGLGTYIPETDGLARGPHGSIYQIGDQGQIVRLDPQGWVNCVIGCYNVTYNGNAPFPINGLPAESVLDHTCCQDNSFDVGPDGSIYLPELYDARVIRIAPVLPGLSLGDTYVGSSDGRKLYVFNPGGQHLETLDAVTGSPIYTFQYAPTGLLTSLTDAEGRVTTIQRDAQGNPVSMTAPDGQITLLATQTVDGSVHLAAVKDPAGDAWTMGYDPTSGLLTSYTDPRGNTDQYTYDSNGFLIKDVDAVGGGWTLARTGSTDQSQPYTVTMASGMGRTYSFAVSQQTDGSTLDLATAPDGTQSSLAVTPSGLRTSTAADGTVTTEQESADPRFGLQSPIPSAITIKTPSGLTWSGGESRSTTLQTPTNLLSLTALQETDTANGQTWTRSYAPTSRTWTTTTPVGRTSAVTVDSLDRPIDVDVPGIAPLAFTYDSAGRMLTASASDGTTTRTTTYSYYPSGPAQGWLQSATDPLGRTLAYQYDPAGRVTQETLPDGSVVQFTYDAAGNLTAVTPPGQPAHAFAYTAVNETAADTPPTTSTQPNTATHYAYNLDRQLTTITRPDGSAVNLTYDTGGRLSSVALPDGTADQYTYVAKTGQLASIVAPGGETLAETWDGFLNTQTQWSGPVAGTVSRTFDDNFRMTALSVNGQSTPYTYDADGLLTQVAGMSLARDAHNGRLNGTAIGSVSTARTYDGFGALASLSSTTGTTSLYQATYTRDADSRITQDIEDFNGVTTTWQYGYDTRGRLVSVSSNGSPVATYGYDGNGNRVSVNGQTVATYNADDQLTSYNGVAYTYATDGSLASAGSTTYRYDALGHLLEAKTPTKDITYTYDGLGRRVGKAVNGTLVQGFLYASGINPIAELDGQGNVVATFVYGTRPNVPDLMIEGGVTYRIISNELGSPVAVVNVSTGAIAEQVGYDVWGNVTSDSNPGFQPFGFAGGLVDADTGLVHFGARDYDPVTGRWTTRDPVGFGGSDTNLYGYVMQDPVNGYDWFGLWSISLSIYDGFGGGLSLSGKGLPLPGFNFHLCSLSAKLGIGLGGGLDFEPNGSQPDNRAQSGANSIGLFGEASAGIGPLSIGWGSESGITESYDNSGAASHINQYASSGPAVGLTPSEHLELGASTGIVLTHYFGN